MPPEPKYVEAEYVTFASFEIPEDIDNRYSWTIKWGVLNYRAKDGTDKQVHPHFGEPESDFKWPDRTRYYVEKPWSGDTDDDEEEGE